MECIKCKSERIADLYGKCSDMCHVSIGEFEHDGYVPRDLNIGGGDDISFRYCLDCGQIQNKFPLNETDLEIEGKEKLEARKENENFDEEEFFN